MLPAYGSNIFSNAANSVMLGISSSIQGVKDQVRALAKTDTTVNKDTTGKTGPPWLLIGGVVLGGFALWKWVLPMLGIRKGVSRSRHASLAKARAAKRRKHMAA